MKIKIANNDFKIPNLSVFTQNITKVIKNSKNLRARKKSLDFFVLRKSHINTKYPASSQDPVQRIVEKILHENLTSTQEQTPIRKFTHTFDSSHVCKKMLEISHIVFLNESLGQQIINMDHIENCSSVKWSDLWNYLCI